MAIMDIRGIHNPLDQKSSDNLMLSGEKSSVLHNNCSGKHLGMISGCLAKKINIKNYLKINNPYQKLIRNVLENFMEKKRCVFRNYEKICIY